MKRNNVFIGILTIIIFGLAAVIFLTVQKLQQTTPVAPTVPQVTPKAATPACTLTFAIAAEPTPTPTPGPTGTPTPTPTPAPACNIACSSNANCNPSDVCFDTGSEKVCRNAQCTSAANCACPTPTPTPTPTPLASCNSSCTTSTDCASGLICSVNACRNPSCTNQTNCVCPVATPTPIVAAPTPTPVTPQVPVAGTGPSVLGASVIVGGILLLLLGLVF